MQPKGEMQEAAEAEIQEPSEDPKSDYYRMSAEQCFLNEPCECCTCHCCAVCIMICWIIFGALGAYGAYSVLEWTSDGGWYTAPCTTTNGIFYEDCCIGTQGLWGPRDVAITGVNCGDVESVYIISFLDNICYVTIYLCGLSTKIINICNDQNI